MSVFDRADVNLIGCGGGVEECCGGGRHVLKGQENMISTSTIRKSFNKFVFAQVLAYICILSSLCLPKPKYDKL